MEKISFTDNSSKVIEEGQVISNETITKKNIEDLLSISNVSLEELCEKNPDILIFPPRKKNKDKNKEKIENPHYLFTCLANEPNKYDFKTSNVMGFLGINDTEITIKSRFASSDDKDFFLHYLLSKVFALNLFNFETSISNVGVLDLIIYTFPYYLKKALSQGLYKNYRNFQRNDARVKGVIDISRHIKNNEPFAGRISYNSRESTFDNTVTELIRHTIEYIKCKPYGKVVINKNSEIKAYVKQIIEATPSYSLSERKRIINKNLKPFSHPFYTEYKNLIKLCLMILNHKKIGYGNGSKKVYGLLFDGAWLWEQYLATFLVPMGFTHPRNEMHIGGIPVYENRMYYPDFYRKDITSKRKNANNYILDAKYKMLDTKYIDRNDLNQLITYMHILPSKNSGLIYPYSKLLEENNNSYIVSLKSPIVIEGIGGTLNTFGVPIPQEEKDSQEFCRKMKYIEDSITKENPFV